ncbi:MAG: MFS transporter [Actinobacteria bacterium]|nr:MFS transporter [Actinomycetota bacterium]
MKNDVKAGWPIYLAAINMRVPIIIIGPLLPILKVEFGLSTYAQSLLTSIPVICFSLMALMMHRINRLGDTNRVLTISVVILFASLLLRTLTGLSGLFIFSILVGISIAILNFMLPVWVKENSQAGSGYITGIYAAIMGTCGSLAVAGAVPLAELSSFTWRLSMLPAIVVAGLVATIWLNRFRGQRVHAARSQERSIFFHPLLRNPSAWAIALYFGCQSMMFYATATWVPTILLTKGFTLSEAGVGLATATFIGSIVGIFIPHFATSRSDLRPSLLAISALNIASFTALALDSGPRAIIWLILGNIGLFISFPISLLLCVLKSSTAEQTKSLSIMSQSLGYFMAALAPPMLGIIFDITLNWNVSFFFIVFLSIVQGITGFFAGKSGKIVTSA